jgi:eukaryotic-like serine/threonine-protein kinase
MTEATVLGERYELGGVLGRGGMAEVRAGRDVRLGRSVAIKMLRTDLARDPSFQARFRREAQSAASLNHPAVVAVYDTGEDTVDGTSVPYIVMEYVEGTTLRELLNSGRLLMPERALEITRGVLDALDYSHRNGIIHRDIKPANVMLTQDGGVKVMDFGIARAVADSSATMTQTSAVIGTAQYLSPEQARGEQVDARTDLYSTGCLLYELLTGRPPFVGDSPVSVAYQHVREDPAPPSSLDPELSPAIDAVVLKSLAKNRDNRYLTAAEMSADIDRVLAGRPVQAPAVMDGATRAMAAVPGGPAAPPPYDEPPVEPPARRRRGPWIALAVALVVAAALAVLTLQTLGGDARKVTVPDLKGKTLTQAQAQLRAAGLRLGQTTRRTDPLPADTILDQNPPANARVAKNSIVRLVLSAGPQKVQVPSSLIGLSEQDAAAALKDVGLRVGRVTTKNSQEKAGQVIGSSPAAGASVPAGSAVDLVVSSGKTGVPNVVGQSEAQARATLVQAGFSDITTVTQPSSAQPGTVLAQAPPAGTSAGPSTPVTLTVATTPSPPPSTAPTTNAPSPSPSPGSPSNGPTPTPSSSARATTQATPTPAG